MNRRKLIRAILGADLYSSTGKKCYFNFCSIFIKISDIHFNYRLTKLKEGSL